MSQQKKKKIQLSAVKKLKKRNFDRMAEEKTPDEFESLSFVDHLRELRKRLIFSLVSFIVFFPFLYYFYPFIIDFLSAPFLFLQNEQTGDSLYISGVLEGFLMRLKVSFFLSFFVSFPIHLYQVTRFVFPGLYPREKRAISAIIFFSFCFVFFSVYYSYQKIIPISINFLLGSAFIPLEVGLLLNFQQSVFFILHSLLAGLMLFQLPIILLILLMMGIVKRKPLFNAIRYVIIFIFVISAVLTPPDPISLLALALPLIVMFLLTLLIAKIFHFGEDSPEEISKMRKFKR